MSKGGSCSCGNNKDIKNKTTNKNKAEKTATNNQWGK